MVKCLPQSGAVHDRPREEPGPICLEELSYQQSRFLPDLPLEILNNIISYLTSQDLKTQSDFSSCLTSQDDKTQPDLSSCCLLSKAWYAASIKPLYNRPHFSQSRFHRFVRTVCLPVNAHVVRDTGLVNLITVLNMGDLADFRSKGMTRKLLRRAKDTLEVFVAPKASFT